MNYISLKRGRPIVVTYTKWPTVHDMYMQLMWPLYFFQCIFFQQWFYTQQRLKPWLISHMLHQCPILAKLQTSSLCRDHCLWGSFPQSHPVYPHWPQVVDQAGTNWGQKWGWDHGWWGPHLVEETGEKHHSIHQHQIPMLLATHSHRTLEWGALCVDIYPAIQCTISTKPRAF